MSNNEYEERVRLLLTVLPVINEYQQFALKGGTAINLFVQEDVPRLSVDIDLVYLKIEDRDTTLINIDSLAENIAKAISKMENIKGNIVKDKDASKVFIKRGTVEVKLEINTVTRGVLYDCIELPLSESVSDKFGLEYSIKIVSLYDLYAGKICAALSRKHPRDLFDVKLMLKHNTLQFNEEFMNAIVIYLSCSNKSFYDLLDHKTPEKLSFIKTFNSKFKGMTNSNITADELIETYEELMDKIHNSLTANQKEFIINLANATPNWDLIKIPNIDKLPGITWKLKNILLYKNSNPNKHAEDVKKLIEKL